MDSNTVQQTVSGLQELLSATIELYQSYFNMLEVAIENTADTDVQRLTQLNALAQEGHEALEADLALFDKAIAMDSEALQKMSEDLKIKELHDKLKGNG